MELRLYDTLTKEKRPFVPLDPNNVRMYVCGPTVYDFAHIGNARPVIVFDVLFRLLRHLYGARSRHLCPQHHRRRRQDQRARRAGFSRPAAERGDPQGHRTDRQAVSRRRRRARLPARRRSSRARPNISPEMRDDHREAGRRRLCLCRRGPRAVLAAGDERGEFGAAALRRAVEPLARRDDRRRARRCRALQARHHRLRAVEAVEAGRAVMAVAGGHQGGGPSGLAHRMLGDGVEASRRAVRHSWRRHRPGVSAS